MPTYTTITENQDGTYSLTVHDADALRRVQTMCDIIREDDDDPEDDERSQVADYAEDLYRIIDDALTAEDRTDADTPTGMVRVSGSPGGDGIFRLTY